MNQMGGCVSTKILLSNKKNGYKLRDIVLASSIIDAEIKFLTRPGEQ